MKIIKSDNRYKYYSSGFTRIVEFKTTPTERVKYSNLLDALEKTHGPHQTWQQQGSWGFNALNDKYRVDFSRKLKRRRIYLKSDEDLTFFILKGAM